ncbi:U-box domain-containing protein 1 [Diplonema papillatum]|nr:U-box domain-containing protein 1 [Diplonema papillatum]
MKTIVFVCAGAFLGWAAAESGFGLAPAADAEVHEGGLVASAGVGRGSRGSEDPPRRAVLLDDVEQPKDGDDKYFPGYIAGAVGALFCCSWRLCFCRFCLRPREPPANTPPADGSENATVSYPGAPDHFLCPITLDVMRDPVVCVDRHHTFEKRAIQQYLGEGHPECPVSRRRMVPADLAPDPALRTEIKAWLAVQHQNALVAAGLLAVVIEAVRAQEQGEAASCGGARCCTLPDSAACCFHFVVVMNPIATFSSLPVSAPSNGQKEKTSQCCFLLASRRHNQGECPEFFN